MASTMDEELLINLVRAHKELYDLNDPMYEVRHKRDYAWQEIGDRLNQSARDCRDKWKRLRDNYRRALKLRKTKSEQGAKFVKKTKYEKLLLFLNPYLIDENESISEPPNYYPDSSNDESSIPEEINSPGTCSSRDSIQNHRPYKRKATDPLGVPEVVSMNSSYPLHSETNYTPQPKRDKITEFFLGLIETIKEFPEDYQIRVKRDIFKVVCDAEESIYKNNLQKQSQTQAQGSIKKEP